MKLCTVYRSERKPETYLYLPLGGRYEDLPAELQQAFGTPLMVMQLKLAADSRLARVDASQVLAALEQQGYYLQLPPQVPVEDEIRKFVERGER
jgi:uncharacterized protein YcgL (UPF0745 family)